MHPIASADAGTQLRAWALARRDALLLTRLNDHHYHRAVAAMTLVAALLNYAIDVP